MADPSHLDRMGRELKCPICLSLLNSAVSLTCNHVFCCTCIERSMKSAPSCPVCKIPFQRREIRPAPHMDSLVNIYKSMEVASGINIFVTQNTNSVKSPVQEDQVNSEKICGMQETHKSVKRKTTVQEQLKRCKNKGKLTVSKASLSTSLGTGKPSFPTKKRVQVTKYPPSETPQMCSKLAIKGHDPADHEPDQSSSMQKDDIILNEKGESTLAPFFWLRDEEEVEEMTQQTDVTVFTGTPPKLPCFSDIKGSDDDVPSKTTPESVKQGTSIAPGDADFIDSEMFEWTQRACSPELYTSPLKTQVALVEDSYDGEVSEKNGCASPDDTAILKIGFDNREPKMNEKDKEHADLASSHPLLKKIKSGSRKNGKRARGGVTESAKKRARRGISEATSASKHSERGNEQIMHVKLQNCGNGPDAENEEFLPTDEIHTNTKMMGTIPEYISSLSGGLNPLIQGNNDDAIGLLAISGPTRHTEDSTSKRNCITRKKDSLRSRRHSRTVTPKLKADEYRMIQKECEASASHLTEKSPADEKQEFSGGILDRKCKINSAKKKKACRKVRFSKESRTLDVQFPGINGKVATEETEGLEEIRSSSRDKHNSSKKVEAKLMESFQSRSGATPSKVVCAFCHSPEECEATGVLVHYLDGKPMAGDLAQGPNVLHSHKNCTEWAPNVFFQDDNAINLESEVTRSRRITCFLCGIKGAALGCYQKSCRKSFHVPCAMLTPECRWDHDNFVMLCPLHACCKLPFELPGSQSIQKRKSVPKRHFGMHKEVSKLSKDDSKACSRWKFHKESKNLVLCCSGLTDAEKGVISQFEKLSGVRILKNWNLSVTHVIASTNEDGACKRTLKVLMGILEGKWIVTIQWVKACLTSMKLVNEKHYEIEVDTHGMRNGPSLGRLRVLLQKPRLFEGLEFYFLGDFDASYKRFLHDLVIAGGGTVLQRKPISGDQQTFSSSCSASTTYIIYSLEPPQKCEPSKISCVIERRRLDAEALASAIGVVATSNSWILSSIAGCKLQSLTT